MVVHLWKIWIKTHFELILVKIAFNPRPTKGGGSWRFVSGPTKTQKKVTPGI